MNTYPKSRRELEQLCESEGTCRTYLVEQRWGRGGFACPRCLSEKRAPLANGRYQCKCGYQASVTAGTIMQDSKLPLSLWLRLFWWLATRHQDDPFLTPELLRDQVGSKARRILDRLTEKLRRIMPEASPLPLRGRVELHRAFLRTGPGDLRTKRKEIGCHVLLAVETANGKAKGFHLDRLGEFSGAEVLEFASNFISPGSTIITDVDPAYDVLGPAGYCHKTVVRTLERRRYSNLRHVDLFAQRLRESTKALAPTGLSPTELDAYLGEIVYRQNMEVLGGDYERFRATVRAALRTPPAPSNGPRPKN